MLNACCVSEFQLFFPSGRQMSPWVPHKLNSIAMYGGDDGARTRDLCRDRDDNRGFWVVFPNVSQFLITA